MQRQVVSPGSASYIYGLFAKLSSIAGEDDEAAALDAPTVYGCMRQGLSPALTENLEHGVPWYQASRSSGIGESDMYPTDPKKEGLPNW